MIIELAAMARYTQIADDLARRVRSGEITAGDELPGVREYARTPGTTSSTVVRAYRYLADAGVITMADRRRARVAGEGAIAAARLLEPERVYRLAGSDDPALGVLLDRLGAAVVPVGARGSFQETVEHTMEGRRPGGDDRHVHRLPDRRAGRATAPDGRGRPIPRRPAREQGGRRRPPPGHPPAPRSPWPCRRPRVHDQNAAPDPWRILFQR